jgi:regulatory protein
VVESVPRITALEPDPRRPEAVRLEIDGVRFGAVPRELVDHEQLVVGREIDPGLQARLGAAADAEAAYRTALRVLEIRSFAQGDLTRRLLRKGHPRPAVDAALQRVHELGLLDDAAYARTYVQTRAARGRGPLRLTRDLLSMGVERSLIDHALQAEWPEGSDQTAVPLALARKRAGQLGGLPRQTKRRRVVAYLARRGFVGREISELVERVVGSRESGVRT